MGFVWNTSPLTPLGCCLMKTCLVVLLYSFQRKCRPMWKGWRVSSSLQTFHSLTHTFCVIQSTLLSVLSNFLHFLLLWCRHLAILGERHFQHLLILPSRPDVSVRGWTKRVNYSNVSIDWSTLATTGCDHLERNGKNFIAISKRGEIN